MSVIPEVVRFAPSPTGWLHPGNARTALLNWAEARRTDGTFILRIDDTDLARSEERYVAGIKQDLAWLGIEPDKIAHQSERFSRYQEAFAQLRERGLVYPCFETPEELELQRKARRRAGKPPVYDRRARQLSTQQIKQLELAGKRPYWRYFLGSSEQTWLDMCRGEQRIDLTSLSDPVIRRADGAWLYTLPSVCDDIDLGITLVVRGADHVTNTAVQIDMFRALSAAPPRFAHHPLLIAGDGSRLSKRDNALSLRHLREADFEREAVVELLLGVGTSSPSGAPSQQIASPTKGTVEAREDTISVLSRIGNSPAHFDIKTLRRCNARIVHSLEFAEVAERLSRAGIAAEADFWHTVRGNISTVAQAAVWFSLLAAPPEVTEEYRAIMAQHPRWREVIAAAKVHLPPPPWDSNTWSQWSNAVREASDARGKGLFLPLRFSLTGHQAGPEMTRLLPMMAPPAVARALDNALACLPELSPAQSRTTSHGNTNG